MTTLRATLFLLLTQLFVLSAFARPPAELSYEEFKKLAEELSPKVDVFSAVWENDPEALIYAGSSRDYLYWLLGEFRGLTTKNQIADKIKELRSLPVIEFRHISSPESDVDILSASQEVTKLNPQDFAIRKFDIEPPHRLNLATEEGRSEVDQGFVSLEKIVLGKEGFRSLPQFKDGVREIFEGNISVDFSTPEKFWNTKYAKSGENHPILLAARYLRVVIQDYAKRYGTKDYPDLQKLMTPMDQNVIKHIKKIISDATSGQDEKFEKFITSKRGLSWLNGSLQKSFRSFSHPTAAYMLMKEMGVLNLIAAHQDKIQSLNGYLLQQQRDENQIKANFAQFKLNPNDIYIPISTSFPDSKLYHGSGDDEIFRAIIYQGFIPSENGLAGSGVYGVSANNIEFARNWNKSGDNIIVLPLSPFTKLVDITQGPGKALFEKWKKQQIGKKTDSQYIDQFAKHFGIDILKYPYVGTEAFVLKNGGIIEKREGVFKQPRPLVELLKMAEALNNELNNPITTSSQELSPDLMQQIISFLQDFWSTPLNTLERKRIINLSPTLFLKSLQDPLFEKLKQKIGSSSTTHVILLLNQTPTQESALNRVPMLMRDDNINIRWNITQALLTQSYWSPEVWAEVPNLMKDTDENMRWNITTALRPQSTWTKEVWALVPALMKDTDQFVRISIATALQSQSTWTKEVWAEVPNLIKCKNGYAFWIIAEALQSKSTCPIEIKNFILALEGSQYGKLKQHYRNIKVIELETETDDCQNRLKELPKI